MPAEAKDGITKRRLISRVLEKGQELLAGRAVFAQRECRDRDHMLRAFIVKPTWFPAGTSHHERTRRNADHFRTVRTLTKLTILLFACVADICQHDECNTATEQEFEQALNHKTGSAFSLRRKIATAVSTQVHCGLFNPGMRIGLTRGAGTVALSATCGWLKESLLSETIWLVIAIPLRRARRPRRALFADA